MSSFGCVSWVGLLHVLSVVLAISLTISSIAFSSSHSFSPFTLARHSPAELPSRHSTAAEEKFREDVEGLVVFLDLGSTIATKGVGLFEKSLIDVLARKVEEKSVDSFTALPVDALETVLEIMRAKHNTGVSVLIDAYDRPVTSILA